MYNNAECSRIYKYIINIIVYFFHLIVLILNIVCMIKMQLKYLMSNMNISIKKHCYDLVKKIQCTLLYYRLTV